MGCQYSLQKSQSNKNFQNELTNLKPIIMFNPSLSFISKRFCRTINTCGHLKDHAINEFSWVVTIVTDHVKHCHLAVTCPVTVATVKTIAIAGYLPYQIIRKQFWWLCDKNAWWKRYTPRTVARFGCNVVYHVIYWQTSPMWQYLLSLQSDPFGVLFPAALNICYGCVATSA